MTFTHRGFAHTITRARRATTRYSSSIAFSTTTLRRENSSTMSTRLAATPTWYVRACGGHAGHPALYHPGGGTKALTRLEIGARQVMLSDMGAMSCAASVLDANHTMFTLTVPGENSTLIKLGDIIAGGELLCWAFEGEVPTSQVEVREKVLAEPSVKRTAESGEAEISLVTAPAALHECFEYSQLELFRGQSHQLHTSRNARLASAAANDHPPVKDTFASTDQILSEAAAASSSRPIEGLPLQSGGPAEQSRAAAMRSLGHPAPYDEEAVSARNGVTIWGVECSPCVDTCPQNPQSSNNGVCDDGGPGSEFDVCELGTDCTDCGSRMEQVTTLMQERGGLSCECDSPEITLSGGAASSHGSIAGTYVKVDGVTRGGSRSVYRQSGGNGAYLYFWEDSNEWMVGPDYNSDDSASLRTVGNREIHCPEQEWSSSWQYRDGSAWRDAFVEVDCTDGAATRAWTGCSFAPLDDDVNDDDDSGGEYPSLKPGALYKLKWTQEDNDYQVRVKFWEVDTGFDDGCGELPDLVPITPASVSTKEYIFTMPDLCGDSSYCADRFDACGAGSFPEFNIRLEYVGRSCLMCNSNIGSTRPFRLLRTYNFDYGYTLRPSSNPLKFECFDPAVTSGAGQSGSNSSGLGLSCNDEGAESDGSLDDSSWATTTAIKIECIDCKVKLKADVHVLIRTTNLDPFAETWSWGDVSLVGKVDVTANLSATAERVGSASAQYNTTASGQSSQTIGPKGLVGLICPPWVIAASLAQLNSSCPSFVNTASRILIDAQSRLPAFATTDVLWTEACRHLGVGGAHG